MTLNDYLEQFRKNMMIISNTANGTPNMFAAIAIIDPMPAGSADNAQNPSQENMERALKFLYDNRTRNFGSAKDLEKLIFETAEITSKGVIREDSAGFNYASLIQIPLMWNWFISNFYWMLTSQCFEVEEIAAFSEYVISIKGHFFSDGSTIISMLMSTYVFMRFDLPCPEYTSGHDNYRAADIEKNPAVSNLYQLPADPGFWKFVSYYMSICPSKEVGYNDFVERMDNGSYLCKLTGHLTGERSRAFRQKTESFYKKYSSVHVIFDCKTLAWIDMDGISVLADLRDSGKQFVLRNLNADCRVLFKIEGFEEYMEEGDKLPKIDLSGCEKINEGAEGVIYRVSDEMVAKTFKKDPDYYDIVRRRIAQKNALIAGVPAPFSFGYAEYDGKIVTLMELINARPLLQIISSEKDYDEYIVLYAQFVKQLHAIRDEEKLRHFDRNLLGEEILEKADRCDRVLPEEYKGRARKIIEAIDEPECLVHGDIHPNNIMVSGKEMMFIDFDSFSTGKGVYDLGNLYRSLLCNQNYGVSDTNSFLKIPFDDCRKIWDIFVGEYYKDEPEEFVEKKLIEAKLIGIMLALAKFIKLGENSELISKWADELVAIESGGQAQ